MSKELLLSKMKQSDLDIKNHIKYAPKGTVTQIQRHRLNEYEREFCTTREMAKKLVDF